MNSKPMIGIALTGGGARAAYQVGVLYYIAEQIPDYIFPIYTGVSAGAINASHLAAHRDNLLSAAKELRHNWETLRIQQVFRCGFTDLTLTGLRTVLALITAGASYAPQIRSFFDTKPLRDYLEGTLDMSGLEENLEKGKLRALALSAMNYSSGKGFTFFQGTPDILPWVRSGRVGRAAKLTLDHVMASTALPLAFPAAQVHGDYFGDGAVRQTAPLAPAIHLGADKILAISVRYAKQDQLPKELSSFEYPAPARVMGMLLNSIFLDSLDADTERLYRINRLIELIPQEARVSENLRPIELFFVHPSEDLGRLGGEYIKSMPLSMRMLLKSLGGDPRKSSDFISYLMFTPPYIKTAVELGYNDAKAQWEKLEKFLVG